VLFGPGDDPVQVDQAAARAGPDGKRRIQVGPVELLLDRKDAGQEFQKVRRERPLLPEEFGAPEALFERIGHQA
jgi:hypothetical protein